VPAYPRILAIASASPPYHYGQFEMLDTVQEYVLGPGWQKDPERVSRASALRHGFAAAHVERRQCAVDVRNFYSRQRSTSERMALYRDLAYALGKDALSNVFAAAEAYRSIADVSDFLLASCTGYAAPGLDVLLPRDFQMSAAVRRVSIGHMGCFGAIVGLRQGLAVTRAYPDATVALLSVEVCSLHLMPSEDHEVMTSFALFGDAGAALLIGHDERAIGPEIVDTHCGADFTAADQMSWNITDQGFIMTLSPRVPVTLRRNVSRVVEGLLAPHGLRVSDIAHWLIHPGGPSILTAIQRQLELTDDQMSFSWHILREHGNCSSATVLLILEALLKSGRARRGEWGIMMAFGPGLTLETCLLRF